METYRHLQKYGMCPYATLKNDITYATYPSTQKRQEKDRQSSHKEAYLGEHFGGNDFEQHFKNDMRKMNQ